MMIDIEKIAEKHGKKKISVMRSNGMGQMMLLDGIDFTKAEIQAFANELQNEVIEMCAKECDGYITDPMHSMYSDAIRNLKVKG